MPENRYCVPNESGLASEAAKVGRRIGKLLDALGTVDHHVCKGAISDDCHAFGVAIRERLIADGWRIKVSNRDTWTVLPPKK